jgi:dihydrofolate reductase
MAAIVSTLFCSLDGVAEIDPRWHFPYFDQDMAAAVTEDYADVDVLLLGRLTYDSFAGAWPEREAAGGEDAAFATQLGDVRKVVATLSQPSLGWRNAVAASDLLDAVRGLRAEPGLNKVLIPGSISIVRQLLEVGEIDELRLLVHPVIAGSGRRLFSADGGFQALQLAEARPFASGVVRLRYLPADLPYSHGYDQAAEHLGAAG